jgi:membrane protease YdiL (CAAX protease family)
MPLWQSLLFFGVPALMGAGAHYLAWPYLVGLGLSEEDGYYCSLMVVFVSLLIAALAAYVLEGNPFNWRCFCHRYRLRRMGWREWKWTLAGLLVYLPLAYLTTLAALAVYELLAFVPPDAAPSGPVTNVPLYLLGLFLNIVSEEIWWRGYVLPRQELQHGRTAWLLHSVLWALFHGFKWWAVPFMLFTTWIIPFIAQRLKNTTPGLVSHAITNGLSALMTLLPLFPS